MFWKMISKKLNSENHFVGFGLPFLSAILISTVMLAELQRPIHERKARSSFSVEEGISFKLQTNKIDESDLEKMAAESAKDYEMVKLQYTK